ncbi:hypothetical protein BMJ22_12160 [Sinorhizobium medicae]|nr:hypothetical protein BMJ22_12160 [Sinorhizobium medicae]
MCSKIAAGADISSQPLSIRTVAALHFNSGYMRLCSGHREISVRLRMVKTITRRIRDAQTYLAPHSYAVRLFM